MSKKVLTNTVHLIFWLIFFRRLNLAVGKGDWSLDNIGEPNCDNCRCLASGLPLNDVRIQKILSKVTYGLFTNSAMCQRDSVTVLGKTVSDRSLDKLCIVSKYTFRSNGDYIGTWGRNMGDNKVLCKPLAVSGFRVADCQVIKLAKKKMGAHAGKMHKSFWGGKFKTSVAWTDGATTLITACYGDKQFTGYYLNSVERQLQPETRNIVLAVLADLGFDTSKAKTLIGCRKNSTKKYNKYNKKRSGAPNVRARKH